MKEYNKLDAAGKRAFTFEHNQQFRTLESYRKRNFLKTLENQQLTIVEKRRKIVERQNIMPYTSDETREKARAESDKIMERRSREEREYKITTLANVYPHSNEKVSIEYATKWVDEHPDLTLDDVDLANR